MPNQAEFKDESEDELYIGMSDDGSSSDGDQGVDEAEDLTQSTPAPRPRPRKKAKQAAFVAGVVLSTPRIVMSTVSQLYDDIKDGDIDLEPDYQRDVVWTAAKQSAIISSLLSHFYVPPILLSSKANGGSTQFVCVDGKQRLTSIKLFMENQIPVRDADGKSFFLKSKNGKRGLPEEVAKRFRREAVATVIYENLNDADEREIFQRVQMGTTLAVAERLAALDTPWSKWIHELTRKYIDPPEDSGGSLGFLIDTSRSKNWVVVAELIFTIQHEDTFFLASGFDKLRKLVGSKDPPSAALRRKVETALKKFITLANDPRWNFPLLPKTDSNRTTGKLLSPVEFVHIGFMVHRYPQVECYHLGQLAWELREGVHTAFPAHVSWVANVVNWMRGKIESFESMVAPRQQISQSGQPSPKKHKRARPAQEQEDDAEMVDQQASSSSNTTAQQGDNRRSSSGRTIRTVNRLVDEVTNGSLPSTGPTPSVWTVAPLSRQVRSIPAPQTANQSAPARTTTFSSPGNNEPRGPLFRSSPEPSSAASSRSNGTYLDGNNRLAQQAQDAQRPQQKQQNVPQQQQPVFATGAVAARAVNGTNGYHSPIATFQRATPQNPYT